MSTEAQQFAERCFASLEGATFDDKSSVLCVLAGSYDAFQLMLAQQKERGVVRTHATPAGVEVVQAFAKEIGAKFDPQEFWDFYQERGWKVGRGIPMKDWKCTARRWHRKGWGLEGGQHGSRLNASLGALQVQLEKVNEEIRDIVRPGGSAHARTASSLSPEEVERYNKLHALKVSLRNRIESV